VCVCVCVLAGGWGHKGASAFKAICTWLKDCANNK
jgi:hypothetical protein